MFTCHHLHPVHALDCLRVVRLPAVLLLCLIITLLYVPLPALCIPACIKYDQYNDSLMGEVSRWNGTPAAHGTIHDIMTGRLSTLPLLPSLSSLKGNILAVTTLVSQIFPGIFRSFHNNSLILNRVV